MIHDMKDQPDQPVAPFDDAAREREWLAQEHAMRRERLQLDPRHDDARTQRYRMLARSLRQPLDEQLPADFAQQLAARLGPVRKRFGTPFEFTLIFVLGLALLAGSAIILLPYGRLWWYSMLAWSQSPTPSISLLLALAACMGLTGLLGYAPTAKKP